MSNEEILDLVINLVFKKNTVQEALQYFDEHKELIGMISLPDCIKVLYNSYLVSNRGKALEKKIPNIIDFTRRVFFADF